MRYAAFLVALLVAVCAVRADVVYQQPLNPAGGYYKSAWYAPDGLDGDEYTWDAFTLTSSAAISEIRWRGCYSNYLSGAGRAPVYAFTISIYRSIAAGSQPDLGTGGRLARYSIGSNAGETLAGTTAGVLVYDYAYTLTTPFQASAGTKYWIQIEASQGVTPQYGWPPDWSLCAATGGDGSHFRFITGGMYASLTGDLALTLLTSGAPTVTIAASVSPAGAGTVTGAGAYPVNSTATLDALPGAGWGFVNWTQNGTVVSSNAHYTFTATADRTLVANFTPAYTVTTAAYPTYGGTTTGAGVYNSGGTVTVSATPNHGFVFSSWSDGATTAVHSFPAAADVILTAIFDLAPLSAAFDFEAATPGTPFPIDLQSGGLTAHFSGTGSGYSIQRVGTVGIAPAGFSGNMVYPSSIFPADLIVDFGAPLSDFSIMYSPHELACDTSATMRATAFSGGVQVGTATTTAPAPGTWPTGTLAIAVATGFDRVVVHYDARPPTCADYGVIFMADNAVVTRLCSAVTISTQPQSVGPCVRANAALTITAGGPGPAAFAYQWQRETPAGSGVFTDLTDGPTGTGSMITGGTTSAVRFQGVSSADNGLYRCVATHLCGSAISLPAAVTVCDADFDCGGAVAVQDIFSYLAAWFAGDPRADITGNRVLEVQDIFAFLAAWFAGCN